MKKTVMYTCVILIIAGLLLPATAYKIDMNNYDPNDIRDPPLPGNMIRPFPEIQVINSPSEQIYFRKNPIQFSNDIVIEILMQTDENLILGYLENLTAFGPRVTGTTACEDSAEYIFNEFDSMGLDAEYHDWNYAGYDSSNVVATLPGINQSSDEIYIICAHYDTVTGSPGADDDGSGVAAVMAAAKIMSQYEFQHTVRFIAFSGEEEGLLGSYEYVAEAYTNGDNIVATLNADMIGYALTKDQGNKIRIYEDDESVWIRQLTDTVSQQYSSLINLEVIPSGYSYSSDHYSFWIFGYNALFYHEYEFNDYYHSPQDTIENMNITYSTKSTRLIIATLAELARPYVITSSPEIPNIDGPDQGKAGVDYDYIISTTDPDDDDVYYYIDWGDGNAEEWIGPYNSGEEITVNHTWVEKDTYTVRVKARDVYDAESGWATLDVKMPLATQQIQSPLLNLMVQIIQRFPLLQQLLTSLFGNL